MASFRIRSFFSLFGTNISHLLTDIVLITLWKFEVFFLLSIRDQSSALNFVFNQPYANDSFLRSFPSKRLRMMKMLVGLYSNAIGDLIKIFALRIIIGVRNSFVLFLSFICLSNDDLRFSRIDFEWSTGSHLSARKRKQCFWTLTGLDQS